MSNLSYDCAFSLEDTLMPRRGETGARLVREFEAAVRAHAFRGTVEHQDVREEIEEEYERAKKRLLAFIRPDLSDKELLDRYQKGWDEAYQAGKVKGDEAHLAGLRSLFKHTREKKS